MDERIILNNKGKGNHFKTWCEKNNVNRFLLDLDDTVCATRKLFQTYKPQAFDFQATHAPQLSRDEWKEAVEAVDNRLFELVGVTPKRWEMDMDEISEKYSLHKDLSESVKGIFSQIYTTPLELLEGAETGLRFLNEAEMPLGIVTHANADWTRKKYDWLGLERFIDWKDVYIVDEHGHKTSESWKQAAKYFGLDANQCAVVGDSPRSDINPAREAGVQHCFLVDVPDRWSVHQQNVDSSIRLIRDLSDLATIGLE